MSKTKYALIGAGPMGLATARQLQKLDIPFQGFELHADVGGLWDINNPHSTMYHSAHLISSKKMTEFAEFPMKDSVATYPSHKDVCEYFQDYAAKFDLKSFFRFNSKVTSVVKEGEKWLINWQDENGEHSEVYTGVLIANGNLHTPNKPQLPGQYTGQVMHSCAYKHAEIFKAKRVLILGCGNSACDIAVDAVHYADKVDMSVRRGYHFLPKFVLGKAIDSLGGKIKLPMKLKQWVDGLLVKALVGKPSDYGLPDPDYKMYESHPVINSIALHYMGHGDIHVKGDITNTEGKTVYFKDGTQEDYDLVLTATGYKLDFPFVDKSLLNWQGDAPNLFLNVFSPNENNLFLMGMVEAAGLGWQGRADQAELVALYIKNKMEEKPEKVAWFEKLVKQNDVDVTGGMNYLNLARMAYYVHKDTYLKNMHQYVKQLRSTLNHAR